MEFKVFITNLGKYNEGELVGKWIDLPCANIEDELAEIGVEPGSTYEEYFITDYDNSFNYEVGEYESLWDLNELADKLEHVDVDWLTAYMDETGESLEEAIDNYENNSAFYEGMTLREVAEDFLEDISTKDLSEFARRYFDYEAFARDLNIEGYHEVDGGVIYVY